MKSMKINVSIGLLIIFEIAVGILLLVSPEEFTRTIITLFGVVLLEIGITYLIRYLREKKQEVNSTFSLIITIVALTIGVICVFCSGAIIGLITAIAIIYGVILVVLGVFKIHNYYSVKNEGKPVSMIRVVSGIVAIILGAVIAVYPKNIIFSVWQVAGVILIVEAVVDFISIIQIYKKKKQIIQEEKPGENS